MTVDERITVCPRAWSSHERVGIQKRPGPDGAMPREAEEVDLTGLKCPMPSLMTRRALARCSPGMLIAVTVTDPLAPLDLRHLCQKDGHEVLEETTHENGARRIVIRRGPLVVEG